MRNKYFIIILMFFIGVIGCLVVSGHSKGADTHFGPEHSYVLTIDENDRVVAQHMEVDLAINLSSYDHILENSTAIIYGEVKSVENFYGEGGTAWVKEEVEVLDTYKGELETGTTIEVVQQTGYIPANEYITTFKNQNSEEFRNRMFGSVSDEELDRLILDQTQGIPLDEPGNRIIFCLWESFQSTDMKTYYEPVGDWAGKQVELDTGEFAQYYPSIGTVPGEDADVYKDRKNYHARSREDVMKLLRIE